MADENLPKVYTHEYSISPETATAVASLGSDFFSAITNAINSQADIRKEEIDNQRLYIQEAAKIELSRARKEQELLEIRMQDRQHARELQYEDRQHARELQYEDRQHAREIQLERYRINEMSRLLNKILDMSHEEFKNTMEFFKKEAEDYQEVYMTLLRLLENDIKFWQEQADPNKYDASTYAKAQKNLMKLQKEKSRIISGYNHAKITLESHVANTVADIKITRRHLEGKYDLLDDYEGKI